MDERFIQMSVPSIDTEEGEEGEPQSEEDNRRESTLARETSTEQKDESFDLTPPTPIGRNRPKLLRNRSPKSPGASNLRLNMDKMTEQQLKQAIGTISDDTTTITIVDNNGN